jgi:hypothetical protein
MSEHRIENLTIINEVGGGVRVSEPHERETRFRCPYCDGSYFGFAGEESDGSLKRYCKTPQKTGKCGFKWNSKDDDKYFVVEVTVLESAVIDAAIRFRLAEKAAWVEGEVGSEESAAQAKAERPRAYIAFVEAVDALLRSKSREESKVNEKPEVKAIEATPLEVAEAIDGQKVIRAFWDGENLDALYFSNGKSLLFNRNHKGSAVKVTIADPV